MKAKTLSFPFISFSESGLFNGLQAIQIKKSPRAQTRVQGCGAKPLKRIPALHFPPRLNRSGARVGRLRRSITQIAVLENALLIFLSSGIQYMAVMPPLGVLWLRRSPPPIPSLEVVNNAC
jgi:hypothetical protein